MEVYRIPNTMTIGWELSLAYSCMTQSHGVPVCYYNSFYNCIYAGGAEKNFRLYSKEFAYRGFENGTYELLLTQNKEWWVLIHLNLEDEYIRDYYRNSICSAELRLNKTEYFDRHTKNDWEVFCEEKKIPKVKWELISSIVEHNEYFVPPQPWRIRYDKHESCILFASGEENLVVTIQTEENK